MCVGEYTGWPEADIDINLSCSELCFLRQGFLLNPQPLSFGVGSIASLPQEAPVIAPLVLGFQVTAMTGLLSCGSGGLNSSLHAQAATTSSSE